MRDCLLGCASIPRYDCSQKYHCVARIFIDIPRKIPKKERKRPLSSRLFDAEKYTQSNIAYVTMPEQLLPLLNVPMLKFLVGRQSSCVLRLLRHIQRSIPPRDHGLGHFESVRLYSRYGNGLK